MKIWSPNDLIFTVFFKREDTVKYIKDIFIENYGEINKTIKDIPFKVIYSRNTNKNKVQWN